MIEWSVSAWKLRDAIQSEPAVLPKNHRPFNEGWVDGRVYPGMGFLINEILRGSWKVCHEWMECRWSQKDFMGDWREGNLRRIGKMYGLKKCDFLSVNWGKWFSDLIHSVGDFVKSWCCLCWRFLWWAFLCSHLNFRKFICNSLSNWVFRC
jgi:hypothetical protein